MVILKVSGCFVQASTPGRLALARAALSWAFVAWICANTPEGMDDCLRLMRSAANSGSSLQVPVMCCTHCSSVALDVTNTDFLEITKMLVQRGITVSAALVVVTSSI